MKWMMTLLNGEKYFFYSLEELSRFVAAEDLSVDKIEEVPDGYIFTEHDKGVIEDTNVNISIFSVCSTNNGVGWKTDFMIRSVRFTDGKTCYRDMVDPIAMFEDKEDLLGRLYEFVGKLWAKNHPNR